MTRKNLSSRLSSILSESGVQMLLTAGLILLFIISSIVHIPIALSGEYPYDFPNYYFGGLRFLEGRPIYDYLEEEIFRVLNWHNRVYPADPPFAVIVLSPLALLSYESAWIVWALVSTSLLVSSIYLTAKELGLGNLPALLLVSIALSAKPFRFLLFANHFETLVLFLSVVGWLLMRRSRFRAGLFAWTLAASLKLFPLLWIVGSVRLIGLRKVLEALLVFSIIFLLSGLCVGVENSRTFLFEILSRSFSWYGVIGNYSLLSLGYALNSPILAWGLVLGFALFLVAVLVSGKLTDVDSHWCALTVASLLLSPLCWWGYLVLVIPCLIVMIFRQSEHRKNILPLILAAFLIWGFPDVIMTDWLLVTVMFSFIPTAILCYLFIAVSCNTKCKA